MHGIFVFGALMCIVYVLSGIMEIKWNDRNG